MLAKELISNSITTLRTSDSGKHALELMDEMKVSHLPIVNDQAFLGLISEDDIMSLNHADEPIGNHQLSLIKPFVFEDQHVYDIIKIFADLKLSLLPVLDSSNNYIGVITLLDVVQNLNNLTAVQNPGGIIILELNSNDYSLSEISRIVESNDAKVLSLYLYSYPDSTKLDVILKINKIDVRPVLQTFSRYNYTVKASYAEKDNMEDLLDRYDLLMNYLNI